MYYQCEAHSFMHKFVAIIGNREAGKTTILKKIYAYAKDQNYPIAIFDSATDHKQKSLLVSIANSEKSQSTFIDSPDKKSISYHHNLKQERYYPYEILQIANNQIFLFDVSKFLEEGYYTDDLEEREKIREYYKRLVLQELYVLQSFTTSNLVILMDEIELIDDMQDVLSFYKSNNITLIVALHSVESLAKCKDLFEVIQL